MGIRWDTELWVKWFFSLPVHSMWYYPIDRKEISPLRKCLIDIWSDEHIQERLSTTHKNSYMWMLVCALQCNARELSRSILVRSELCIMWKQTVFFCVAHTKAIELQFWKRPKFRFVHVPMLFKGKTGIESISMVHISAVPPVCPGIDPARVWRCAGVINIVLPKDISSIDFWKDVSKTLLQYHS